MTGPTARTTLDLDALGEEILFRAVSLLDARRGALYAVAASGLVLTYTTSGIFNFAHGAFGMFAAFLYWQFAVE